MIGSKGITISSGGLQMGGFCLVVDANIFFSLIKKNNYVDHSLSIVYQEGLSNYA